MQVKDQKVNFNQRTFSFSLNIIALTDSLPNQRSCWVIADQLVRAATSIGANVAEAKGASSRRDYVNFYTHALKSANETKYWLSLLNESKKAPTVNLDSLIKESTELANILAASIITMKNHKEF